jgi:hypothetical protein
MRENALDEKGILNTGDHAERTAAATTELDVDGEDAFETLHPAHAHVFGERIRVGFLVVAASPSCRGDRGAQCVVRGEHPVVSGEVAAGRGHEGGQASQEVQRLQAHVGGAIAIGGLQLEDDLAVRGESEALLGYGGSAD